MFGVGFAALNTGNNLLYLVLALMLSFLVLSGLLSEASLRAVRVERRLPRELFAGIRSRIVLEIQNEQQRVASLAITLEDRLSGSFGSTVAGRTFVLRVPPGASVERSYVFEPGQRGPLRWTEVRVSTRFPFGLFVKSAILPCESTALVYPHVERVVVPALAARDARFVDDGRARITAGDEVTGLREYVPGDPPGRVQWRPSLRTQRWLIGERGGDGAADVEIELALPPGSSHDLVESRISRAASEAVTHLEAGRRVGLLTPRAAFAPRADFEHRTALLSHLARFQPEAPARADEGIDA